MIPGARDPEGRLFVTTAAPAATDPYMAGLRLTPIGELYVTGLNQAWSPARLFVNGEQGAWYDPSDLSTLFQDAAGTIPVTADGQPVGLMLDKSGNGNHSSQTTSTARPIYRTDGTYHWLEFDGVDDGLSTATIDFSSTDKMSAFSGIARNSDVAAVVVELSPNLNENDGSFFTVGGIDSGIAGWSANFRGTSVTPDAVVGTNADLSAAVIALEFDIAAPHSAMRYNAELVSSANASVGAGNFGNWPLFIGQRGSPPLFFNGSVYSLIVRGALSSPQEITDTETWVNSKTGAY